MYLSNKYQFVNKQDKLNIRLLSISLFIVVLGYFIIPVWTPMNMVRAIFLTCFLIYFFLNNPIKSTLFVPLMWLLLLYLIPISLSDNIYHSFYIYIKFCISSLFFIVGFSCFKSIESLFLLNRYYILILFSLIIYSFVSNIFEYGQSTYLDDSFYFGDIGVNITKLMLVLCCTIPLTLMTDSSKFNRMFYGVGFLLAILIIIIGVKRAALLALIFAFLTLLFLSSNRVRILKYLLLGSIFLIAFSPFYKDIVVSRFMARSEAVSFGLNLYENEARYSEIVIILNNITEKSIFSGLFGTSPFLVKPNYYGYPRMNHIDYTNLLDGAGFVGLVLYLYFYINLAVFFFKNLKKQSLKIYKGVCITGIVLIIVKFVLGIAGTITELELCLLVMLYLGALSGIIVNQNHSLLCSKNPSNN